MAVGNAGGGYANLEASPNYVGEAIKYNIDNGFRIRAEKRLDDQNKVDAEEKRVAREDKEVKEIALENKNFDITQSGVQGIDGKVLELVHKNQDQVNEFNKILYNPLSTKEAKINAQMQKGRVFDNLKQLSETNTNFKTILAGIQKGVQDGTLDAESSKEALDRAKTLMGGNYHFDQNNEGLGTIDFYETDKDGRKVTDEKGNPKIKSSQTYTEFLSSLNPDRASTYEKDMSAFIKNYKPDKHAYQVGSMKYDNMTVDKSANSKDRLNVRSEVVASLKNGSNLKIKARENNIDLNDPNSYEKLVNILTNNHLNTIHEETKQEIDTSLLTQQETARQHRIENEQKRKESEGIIIQPVTVSNKNGEVYINKDTGEKEVKTEGNSNKLIHIPNGSKNFQFAPTKKQLDYLSGKGSATGIHTIYAPKGSNNMYMTLQTKAVDNENEIVAGSVPIKKTISLLGDGAEFRRHLALNGYANEDDFRKQRGIKTITTKNQTTTKVKKEYKAKTQKGSR